jgi:hypothetical protein
MAGRSVVIGLWSMSRTEHLPPYSNIEIVILAVHPSFPREKIDQSSLGGLLPIGNRPLLSHLVHGFHAAGFTEITFVCPSADANIYRDFLVSDGAPEVRFLDSDNAPTTCDVIRHIKSLATTAALNRHLFLYPIELLTAINPIDVVDFHLRQRASLTVVASAYAVDESEYQSSPVTRVRDHRPRRFISYDESDPTRLIALLSDESAHSEDLDLLLSREEEDQADPPGLEIASDHLSGFRSLIVDGSLNLTGLYVVAPAAAAELRERRNVHSLESEFIPTVCARPCSGISLFIAPKTAFALRVGDWGSIFQANVRCGTKRLPGFKPMGEFISTDGETGYFRGNALKCSDKFKFSANCVYGDGLSVPTDDVEIVRSVIGRYCRIGKGSKLYNSVLFDHVTIEDGVLLRNCLVGSNATVRTGCKLTQCAVGADFACGPGLQANNLFVKSDEPYS